MGRERRKLAIHSCITTNKAKTKTKKGMVDPNKAARAVGIGLMIQYNAGGKAATWIYFHLTPHVPLRPHRLQPHPCEICLFFCFILYVFVVVISWTRLTYCMYSVVPTEGRKKKHTRS